MTSNQWITAGIIAILLMIGSLPFSDTAFAQGFQNDQITIVEIGGNTLRVPTKYFLGTNPRAREVPGIFIKALSPSMDPMQENNKDEFLYAKGLGRTVGIGIGRFEDANVASIQVGSVEKVRCSIRATPRSIWNACLYPCGVGDGKQRHAPSGALFSGRSGDVKVIYSLPPRRGCPLPNMQP